MGLRKNLLIIIKGDDVQKPRSRANDLAEFLNEEKPGYNNNSSKGKTSSFRGKAKR